MKRTTANLSAALLAAIIAPFAASASDPSSSLYGSIEVSASALLDEAGRGDGGFRAENRWIFESRPEDGLSFRAEGGWRAEYGAASTVAALFAAGLAPVPAALPPDTDLHREFFLDRAALSASLGAIALDAGVVAPAWGAGYLVNPSDRTNRPAFPGASSEVVPGALGAVLRAYLPAGLSAEAYALAQSRARSQLPNEAELGADRFPFGIRLLARTDALDAALGFLRELPASGVDPSYWATADATGFAGPLTLYAEAALRLPGLGAAPAADAWNAADELEACAGLAWTVPVADVVLRAEGAWFGSGAESKAAYDLSSLLSGRTTLLARRYLFALAEKEDPEAAAWKLGAGVLANLDDSSAAVQAQASWKPYASLELSIWARAFLAEAGDELGGELGAGPVRFTPYRPTAGLGAKLSY